MSGFDSLVKTKRKTQYKESETGERICCMNLMVFLPFQCQSATDPQIKQAGVLFCVELRCKRKVYSQAFIESFFFQFSNCKQARSHKKTKTS